VTVMFIYGNANPLSIPTNTITLQRATLLFCGS